MSDRRADNVDSCTFMVLDDKITGKALDDGIFERELE